MKKPVPQPHSSHSKCCLIKCDQWLPRWAMKVPSINASLERRFAALPVYCSHPETFLEPMSELPLWRCLTAARTETRRFEVPFSSFTGKVLNFESKPHVSVCTLLSAHMCRAKAECFSFVGFVPLCQLGALALSPLPGYCERGLASLIGFRVGRGGKTWVGFMRCGCEDLAHGQVLA